MSAKLSVIFYIILCLEIGIVLTLLPWIPQGTLGLSDWGNNYFLLYAARKTGMQALQTVVASGWMRGAVTGVGLLNIGIAFWEIFHFRQTVRTLQESTEPLSSPTKMPFDLHRPLIYLITSGQTTAHTTPGTEDFSTILKLIRAAVVARIDLVQIREKNLSASVLYQLSASAVGITQGGSTKLLINDRSDIASAVAADGVHLTTSSLPTDVVRRTFGTEFLIGVSTHSVEEVSRARRGGADFVVFGPVFDTASKKQYGDALGLTRLDRVSSESSPFPVLAIGGITIENVAECIRAGARGIAAIGMLQQPDRLPDVADEIRRIVGKASA